MRHGKVRELLYDYLQSGMDPLLKNDIERHLAHCESCFRDLRALKTVLDALPRDAENIERAMDQKDWDHLHASIMHRVQSSEEQKRRSIWRGAGADRWIGMARPRYAIAAGIAVAVIGLLWFLKTPVVDQPSVPRETVQTREQGPIKLGRYFRKSRALLTGLSNLDPPADSPIDLSVEREISRQLMIEGRSLRGQNLDPRSDRLIGDVDRIMKRVSSAPEEAHPPDIQIIRRDIRGQNLLVKLRVAETSYANDLLARPGEGL